MTWSWKTLGDNYLQTILVMLKINSKLYGKYSTTREKIRKQGQFNQNFNKVYKINKVKQLQYIIPFGFILILIRKPFNSSPSLREINIFRKHTIVICFKWEVSSWFLSFTTSLWLFLTLIILMIFLLPASENKEAFQFLSIVF